MILVIDCVIFIMNRLRLILVIDCVICIYEQVENDLSHWLCDLYLGVSLYLGTGWDWS